MLYTALYLRKLWQSEPSLHSSRALSPKGREGWDINIKLSLIILNLSCDFTGTSFSAKWATVLQTIDLSLHWHILWHTASSVPKWAALTVEEVTAWAMVPSSSFAAGRAGLILGTNSLGVIWVICPCQKHAGLSENTENGHDGRHRKWACHPRMTPAAFS